MAQSPDSSKVPSREPTAPAASQLRAPWLTLEVLQGKTQYPVRSVTKERFLIGSGSGCDLRLGGAGMPSLHSIVLVRPQEILIESVAAEPQLMVNGRAQRFAVLNTGDLVEIGGVSLMVEIPEPVDSIQSSIDLTNPYLDDLLEPGAIDATSDLSHLSAEELVDLIGQGIEEIEAQEVAREAGAAALLDAVQRRQSQLPARKKLRIDSGEQPAPVPHIPALQPELPLADVTIAGLVEETRFLREMESLSEVLNHLSAELQRQGQLSSEREAVYATSTTQLMDAQQKLATQLETLLSQVRLMQQASEEPQPRTRAIA